MLALSLLVSPWWCPNSILLQVLRMFGAEIGVGVSIRHRVRIHWPWKLTVGDYPRIGEDAWILNLGPVTIGSNTCISQSVLLCTGSHDRRSESIEFDNAPIVVGDRAWIAARAAVLCGVTIGDDATIGATALVTVDVAGGATVVAPAARRLE